MNVRVCLWFKANGLAAARFYCSLIEGSKIENEPAEGAPEPMVVQFNLGGVLPLQILSGATHELTPATSISVSTPNQSETDRLWSALLADGGVPTRCGWLTDKFGVTWQIVPDRLGALIGSSDAAASRRTVEAMLKMEKLDIAVLEAAFEGK